MKDTSPLQGPQTHWFAIKTHHDFRAEHILRDYCEDVFFPVQSIKTQGAKLRVKPVIPHVLFIKTTAENALALEQDARKNIPGLVPFWIYRYPNDSEIQIISENSIELLRLLTADDTAECKIYNGDIFKERQRVRITDGIYKGYEGVVQRIKKNKHVIVRIEGVCMVILPFIHPDLLAPLSDSDS
nr:hypothetical protein [Bacteroides sp.]